MNRSRGPFLFLFALALLSLFVAALAWAQGDTPIVISDGSLTMESRGVPWSRFTAGGNVRRHPDRNKTVTAVDLRVNGNSQTIPFSSQQCTVTADYGSTRITISTDSQGRNLQVSTDFSSFHNGATPNHLAHNIATGRIGAITVKKGNPTAFSGTGNGGTVITIHYQ